MPIKKGDRLRNKQTGRQGTAVSGENGGTVLVEQDDGVTTVWSVYDCDVILE